MLNCRVDKEIAMKKFRRSFSFVVGLLAVVGLIGCTQETPVEKAKAAVAPAARRHRQQGKPQWMRYRLRWIKPVRRKVCWRSRLNRGPLKLRNKGMEADDLLCSRNARSRNPLVGRAQWKINQPPSSKRERASELGGTISQ